MRAVARVAARVAMKAAARVAARLVTRAAARVAARLVARAAARLLAARAVPEVMASSTRRGKPGMVEAT